MQGSGTRGRVPRIRRPCLTFDIHEGYDACDPNNFPVETVDFIWVHPPYWRQKRYADDPRDLSRSPTMEHFCGGRPVPPQLRPVPRPWWKAGRPHGRLLGRRGRIRPVGLSHETLAFEAGLRQHCTDIIRFSHGATAAEKSIAVVSSPAYTTCA